MVKFENEFFVKRFQSIGVTKDWRPPNLPGWTGFSITE